MYHPDLNPEGIEHFAKVLRAYETLSDPVLKQAYDYKLNYHQAQTQQAQGSKTAKTWSFTEKEMKRRQYYDEHIRKYAKQTASSQSAEVKPHYNEFKYILYATPLAVILFVIIMALSNRSNPTFSTGSSPSRAAINRENIRPSLKGGQNVYEGQLGVSFYASERAAELFVKNHSGKEAVVCVYTDQGFVRSFYLPAGDSGHITQLPNQPLHVRYTSGSLFDTSLSMAETSVKGGFKSDASYYQTKRALRPKRSTELSLDASAKIFETTNAQEFFKITSFQ